MALIPRGRGWRHLAVVAQPAPLGLEFWGVPLACLALTVGYLVWMILAERRERTTGRDSRNPGT